MELEQQFNKAIDLRTLAQRIVEAAAGNQPDVVEQYVREAATLVEDMLTTIELELPRFAVDTPSESDRETLARQMLQEHHELTVKVRILDSISRRTESRLGPTHDITIAARERQQQVQRELDALTWTILELMGVE